MLLRKWSLTIGVLALGQTACGSGLDRNIGEVRELLAARGAGNGDCAIAVVSDSEASAGYQSLDINALQLEENGEYISVCRIMKRNGMKSAVIQFAGVTCLSCQDEAIFYNDLIPQYKDQGVGHMVALTDRKNDYPESMFKYFMSAYAESAVRVHDQNEQAVPVLWKYFSKDPQFPNRPTVVALNIEGKGFVVNDKSVDMSKAAEKALELAGIVSNGDQGSDDNSNDSGDDNSGDDSSDNPGDDSGDDSELPPLQLNADIPLNKGYSGQVASLSDLFDSEYLIVDVSQYNCIYCTELADEHQQSSSFQAAMATDKCSSLTVIPDKDYQRWVYRYPVGSYVGNSTYSTSTPLWQVVQQLGLQGFRGTPTIMLINRQGQIVAQNAGQVPSQIKQICGY